MTPKDRFFGGKFDPQKLENAMNAYSSEGWHVITVATATIPSLTGKLLMNAFYRCTTYLGLAILRGSEIRLFRSEV
jgi:hypothetical protein